jgi:hypothetical protein
MRVTVFTAVLGQTDPLRACVPVPGVRYVVLTDRPLAVPPYETVPYFASDSRLASRHLKICANHPTLGDADVTLWHDAACQLRCDPLAVAAAALAGGVDVCAFKHPHRSRIEDEAEAVARLGYMPRAVTLAQVAHYRAAGFVDQTAITSTGFCLRRRTPAVEVWQRLWWDEVERWGWRDQLSVDYALWRSGVQVRYLTGHYRDNPHAKWFNNQTPGPRVAVRV